MKGTLRQTRTGHLFTWSIPSSYWDVVGAHLPLAVLTGAMMVLPRFVPLDVLPLRPCLFLRWTGYPCPFCGFTRSLWALGQGDWAFGAYQCPLALLLFVSAAFVFAWNAAGLALGVRLAKGPLLGFPPHRTGRYVSWVITALALNWAYRLSIGLQ
jgi:hypothetical protein